MTTLLITHPSFLHHDTGAGHPEQAARMQAIDQALAAPEFQNLRREEAPLRADIQKHIERAHTPDLFERLSTAAQQPERLPKQIDPDTILSAGSWDAALRAVGAVLRGVDAVMDADSGITNVFCQVRPPGHHATRTRSMGFCIFSNVAIAGLYARATYGLDRVAVLDFDVHHGNGTQEIFWSDPNLFYGSSHQMPHYPGTGSISERGMGNIWNAPLKADDGGTEFRQAWETRLLPALDDFKPEIILVSAGFDGHRHDPLGKLRLVESDFQWITEKLTQAAHTHCKGRLVSALEGGYIPADLALSTAAHVQALMGA